MILTHVQLDLSNLLTRAAVEDAQAMHSLVIHTALAGEARRLVLWAAPTPGALIIRHHRPIHAEEFPAGWVRSVTHVPQWSGAPGAHATIAVIMERKLTYNAGQRDRIRAAGRSPHHRKIRQPRAMQTLLEARLAPVMDVISVASLRCWRVQGHRPRSGHHMWAHPILLNATGVITDPSGLAAMMDEGVGSNRSYGCGLILARPASAAVVPS